MKKFIDELFLPNKESYIMYDRFVQNMINISKFRDQKELFEKE